jgi:UDP-N-acetylmuramate--alanine ligase
VLQNRGEDRLVVEADEFDRSFLSLYPELAIVTSTDADHLDIYGSHAEVIDAFRAFMSQVKEGGIAILKKEVAYLAESTKARVFTYSLTEQADFTVSNLTIKDGYYHFNINTPVGIFPDIMLGIPGKYNVENALAASAAAILWGISAHELRRGLESFAGVQRRFDVRFRDEKTIFIDDYAHHPQELWAAITSVRELFPKKRITGVFQPHLFTRTRDFAEDFARSLDLLDEVVLLEIYPARELPIEGISSQTIKNLMRNQQVTICPKEQLVETLHTMNPEVLITMGAGDIDRLVNPIAEMLKTRN